jgi:hypothetical protein
MEDMWGPLGIEREIKNGDKYDKRVPLSFAKIPRTYS